MSTRVIDIYFPRAPYADATIPFISALSSGHSPATTFISQEEAINIQGPPLLLKLHAHFHNTQ